MPELHALGHCYSTSSVSNNGERSLETRPLPETPTTATVSSRARSVRCYDCVPFARWDPPETTVGDVTVSSVNWLWVPVSPFEGSKLRNICIQIIVEFLKDSRLDGSRTIQSQRRSRGMAPCPVTIWFRCVVEFQLKYHWRIIFSAQSLSKRRARCKESDSSLMVSLGSAACRRY